MTDLDEMEKAFATSAREQELMEEIEALKKELAVKQKTLEEYGIEDEAIMSDVEYICIKGIEKLKPVAEAGMMDTDQAKVFDTLHKNLRMARGSLEKKDPKGKQKPLAELIKIASVSNDE